MKNQAWRPDDPWTLGEVVRGLGCLIGGVVVGFVYLSGLALLMAAALDAGR